MLGGAIIVGVLQGSPRIHLPRNVTARRFPVDASRAWPMRRTFSLGAWSRWTLASVFASAACFHQEVRTSDAKPSMPTHEISESQLRVHVGVLAADSMLGRLTPGDGLERAAAYVASVLRRAGVRPAGDEGTYIQRYGLELIQLDTTTSGFSSVAGRLSNGSFVMCRGAATAPQGVTGRAVLVSGSPTSPGAEAALAHADLRDAVVLLILPDSRSGIGSDFWALARALDERLPRAMILLTEVSDTAWRRRGHSVLAAHYEPTERVRRTDSPPILEIRAGGDGAGKGGTPAEVLINRLRAVGVRASVAWASSSSPLVITSLSSPPITVQCNEEVVGHASAPTVVGIIPGSDSVVGRQAVVLSAHLDHLGTVSDASRTRPVGPIVDTIYNGADDNASGVAAVLDVAQSIAASPFRLSRSVLLVFPSGEESGDWGTKHFVAHPPIPLALMAADINSDMLARNAPDTIALIDGERGTLASPLRAICSLPPIVGAPKAPVVAGDLWPNDRLYERSDQIEFSAHGVPAVLLTSGLHGDYHTVRDQTSTLDFKKLFKATRVLLCLANAVAARTWSDSTRHIVSGSSR